MTHDLLYRRTDLIETATSSTIAHWEYFGPSRVVECQLQNGLTCTFLNNARTRSAIQPGQSTPGWGDDQSDRLGFDGASRPVAKRYVDGTLNASGGYSNTQAVVGFTSSYDKASNKFFERELHAESRSHLYEPFDANNDPTGGYDSLDRLRQYQRGTLSSTGGGSITTPISLPGTDEDRSYDLDGLGNWRRTSFDPVGGSAETQIRQHNGRHKGDMLLFEQAECPL